MRSMEWMTCAYWATSLQLAKSRTPLRSGFRSAACQARQTICYRVEGISIQAIGVTTHSKAAARLSFQTIKAGLKTQVWQVSAPREQRPPFLDSLGLVSMPSAPALNLLLSPSLDPCIRSPCTCQTRSIPHVSQILMRLYRVMAFATFLFCDKCTCHCHVMCASRLFAMLSLQSLGQSIFMLAPG